VKIDSFLVGEPHVIYVPLHVVKLADLKNQALLRFVVADALSFEPVKKVSGTYKSVTDDSSKASSHDWTSNDDGLVQITDKLTEGLYDVTLPNSAKNQESSNKLTVINKV
jgi:hypothetical protein